MLSFIKKLFRDPTADWPRSVCDPLLGELRLSDDAGWWEGCATVGNRTLGFKIAGKNKPDARLIAHAHDIVQSLPEFEHSVSLFLAEQARTVKHLARFADEIRQLMVEYVCLVWAEFGGAIMFHGSHAGLVLTVKRPLTPQSQIANRKSKIPQPSTFPLPACSSIQKWLPFPIPDSTPTAPPIRSTPFRTIASPIPVPGNACTECNRSNNPKILL